MSADELLCVSLFLLIHIAELKCGKQIDTKLSDFAAMLESEQYSGLIPGYQFFHRFLSPWSPL